MKRENKRVESRVQRNSTKNRLKRRVKKNLKNLPKNLLKNFVYLIVGLIYTIYLIIRWFDNLVVRLFMKLPRWSRAVILWALVISNVYHNFDIKVLVKETTIENKIVESTPQNTTTLEETTQIETKQEEEYICTLEHETACKIKKKAEEYGIDWKIAVSISAWETGYWTSSLYHNNKNIGGLYCTREATFYNYETLEEGINAFVSNLKRNYFDMGLDTLEKIQPVYCPIGAENDPDNLNKNWLSGVNKIYQELNSSK